MNNAFYGKTMENIMNHITVKFATDETKFTKYMNSPLLAAPPLIIKEDGLSLVKLHSKKIKLNKPIYVGATILENSKLKMFQLHYDVIKKVYPNALMLKTDTDSLLYQIFTDDLYDDFKKYSNIARTY